MSLKTVETEVAICDVCGRKISNHPDYEISDSDYFCEICGKQLCYDCIEHKDCSPFYMLCKQCKTDTKDIRTEYKEKTEPITIEIDKLNNQLYMLGNEYRSKCKIYINGD